MSCFVPAEHRHLPWHLIRSAITGVWERAEWVNNPEYEDGGYWLRWGHTGDFPSLCQAVYIGPHVDQDGPYYSIDDGGRPDPRWQR